MCICTCARITAKATPSLPHFHCASVYIYICTPMRYVYTCTYIYMYTCIFISVRAHISRGLGLPYFHCSSLDIYICDVCIAVHIRIWASDKMYLTDMQMYLTDMRENMYIHTWNLHGCICTYMSHYSSVYTNICIRYAWEYVDTYMKHV